MEFVYRLVAKMDPANDYDIADIQGTGVTRSVAHIQSGNVQGPGIEGIVVENSGADWAERVHSQKVSLSVLIEERVILINPRSIISWTRDMLSRQMTDTLFTSKLAVSSDLGQG